MDRWNGKYKGDRGWGWNKESGLKEEDWRELNQLNQIPNQRIVYRKCDYLYKSTTKYQKPNPRSEEEVGNQSFQLSWDDGLLSFAFQAHGECPLGMVQS